jgi:hypothetical protein
MATQLEVFNMTLGRIGNFSIADVDEASAEAGHCRLHADLVRKTLLRDFDWNFATQETTLSEGDAAEDTFGYTYNYELPDDYLQALEFNDVPAGTTQTRWKIYGILLYSDVAPDDAVFRYVADIDDCEDWDDIFTTTYTWYLAAAIAPAISNSPAMAAELLRAGQAYLKDAKAGDVLETSLKVIRGQQHSRYQAAREGRTTRTGNWMTQDWGPPN